MDISTGLRISSFLHNTFPIIAIGGVFLLCTFLLCRKKALTEQNNAYGVDKVTGKDRLYTRTVILMAIVTLLSAVCSIGGDHLYCYIRAKERYEDVHSFTSENLDFMQMIAELSLHGKDLSDAENGIAELRDALSNDSVHNYYQKNPFRRYFYHAYSKGDSLHDAGWISGILYTVCEACKENDNDLDNVEYYSLADTVSLDYMERGFLHFYSDRKLFLFIGVAAIGLLFSLYMYPSKIARKKEHDQTAVIVWLNALLGWTVIGWIVMLIWGNSAQKSTSANEGVLVSDETEKLLKLKTLAEQGAITQEEYEQKRKELLSKM